MKVRFLGAASLLLAACATTQSTADRISAKYGGQHIDQFFFVYGPPVQRYTMSNGDTFYTWHSAGTITVHIPASYDYQGSVGPGEQVYGTATQTGGGTLEAYCEVRFLTAPDGTIKRVEMRDSLGLWQDSRCAEVLHKE